MKVSESKLPLPVAKHSGKLGLSGVDSLLAFKTSLNFLISHAWHGAAMGDHLLTKASRIFFYRGLLENSLVPRLKMISS